MKIEIYTDRSKSSNKSSIVPVGKALVIWRIKQNQSYVKMQSIFIALFIRSPLPLVEKGKVNRVSESSWGILVSDPVPTIDFP